MLRLLEVNNILHTFVFIVSRDSCHGQTKSTKGIKTLEQNVGVLEFKLTTNEMLGGCMPDG